jgi:hypothetical protein
LEPVPRTCDGTREGEEVVGVADDERHKVLLKKQQLQKQIMSSKKRSKLRQYHLELLLKMQQLH